MLIIIKLITDWLAKQVEHLSINARITGKKNTE